MFCGHMHLFFSLETFILGVLFWNLATPTKRKNKKTRKKRLRLSFDPVDEPASNRSTGEGIMQDAGEEDAIRLLTIFLGANDASLLEENPAQHVPGRQRPSSWSSWAAGVFSLGFCLVLLFVCCFFCVFLFFSTRNVQKGRQLAIFRVLLQLFWSKMPRYFHGVGHGMLLVCMFFGFLVCQKNNRLYMHG